LYLKFKQVLLIEECQEMFILFVNLRRIILPRREFV